MNKGMNGYMDGWIVEQSNELLRGAESEGLVIACGPIHAHTHFPCPFSTPSLVMRDISIL